MKVFVSNKLEILVKRMASELSEPLSSPLASETIIVQSSGMQKWISLKLASLHGICANYRFPFPNKFVEEVFEAFIPEYKSDLSYDLNVTTWKLMDLIAHLGSEDYFQPLRNYLGDHTDPLKLYQLAQRIAVTFDQYLIFRPDMVLNWEEGKMVDAREIWQAKLWQTLVKSSGGLHKARLRKLYLSRVKESPYRKEMLPERISIFGISYLPPYHLEVLFHLSKHLPVNYYYLNPSQEFWADIKSGREISSSLGKVKASLENYDVDLLHLESGNALLASLGSVGRDFFRQLGHVDAHYIDLFEPPPETGLLSSLQSDVYFLQDKGRGDIPGRN